MAELWGDGALPDDRVDRRALVDLFRDYRVTRLVAWEDGTALALFAPGHPKSALAGLEGELERIPGRLALRAQFSHFREVCPGPSPRP